MQRYHLIRKDLAISIMFLLLIPCVIPSYGQSVGEKIIQSFSEGNIFYVGGTGDGNYTKIQDAINDSSAGDTIYVYNNSSPYYEHLMIEKSLFLIGEDTFSTEINGSLLENSLDTMYITGDYVAIRNFRISHNRGYYYQAAVNVRGDYLTLSDCIIQDNSWIGISLVRASFCQILNCELYGNLMAINFVNSKGNTIQNCVCQGNSDAITLYEASDNNQLINCTCIRNSFSSIHIQQSSGNQIIGCVCQDGYDGISLAYAPNTKMRNNTLVNNYANFGIGSSSVSDFYCDIDTSNTINGKPMYYLIGQDDLLFDETIEIGFLGLIECENISVQNSDFRNNFEGMVLAGTSSSVIENCSFMNNEGHGMYLISSLGNLVRNCTFTDGFFDGIFLYDSSNNIVESCSISGSAAGVRLEYSTQNTLLQETIDDCVVGIFFGASYQNNLRANEMFHCGLQVTGTSPDEYINDVDTTNLVNSDPVYYYVDEHNQTIPPDAGQVILVSSSHCTLTSLNLSDASLGIELAYSSLNTIENNVLTGNRVAAIDFDGANNNMNVIENNIIHGNNYGIDIDASVSNSIKDNVLTDNGLALSLNSAMETILVGNTLQNHFVGIYFDHSSNNRLVENIIQNANGVGLYFVSSNGNDLEENHLMNCSLMVYGMNLIEYVNSVDASNTVNGKPIYYLLNQIGITVPQDAGEVILVNASRCTVENLYLNTGTVGITLAYSSNTLIQDNLIEDQSMTGIDLSSGSNENNTIQGNIIQRNSLGIDIENSNKNSLRYNIVNSNSIGLLLYNTIQTSIRRNTIVQNSQGVYAVQSTDSIIRWNNIFLNSQYGLSVDGCTVSAQRNWWGSVKGPVVDQGGSGDHLRTIRNGQIDFVPWHRLPVLFSGILRFLLTINQEKNSINKQFITPERTSDELSQSSSVDFTIHGMKTKRIEPGQNVHSKSPLEKNFLE